MIRQTIVALATFAAACSAGAPPSHRHIIVSPDVPIDVASNVVQGASEWRDATADRNDGFTFDTTIEPRPGSLGAGDVWVTYQATMAPAHAIGSATSEDDGVHVVLSSWALDHADVCAHELGHALGLRHRTDGAPSVMTPSNVSPGFVDHVTDTDAADYWSARASNADIQEE